MKLRVMHIIVNDFESQKLYVINFINRQIFYCFIGIISKENIIHIALSDNYNAQ